MLRQYHDEATGKVVRLALVLESVECALFRDPYTGDMYVDDDHFCADSVRRLTSENQVEFYRTVIYEINHNSEVWYAVQTDPEDEWGYGSYSKSKALQMLWDYKYEYPDALIAVIKDDVCIEEIREVK